MTTITASSVTLIQATVLDPDLFLVCVLTLWENLQDWLSTQIQIFTPLSRDNIVFDINMDHRLTGKTFYPYLQMEEEKSCFVCV